MSNPNFFLENSLQIRKSVSGKIRRALNLAVKVGAIVKVKEQKASDSPPYPATDYSTGQRKEQYYPRQNMRNT
jgi:hypothetical protein